MIAVLDYDVGNVGAVANMLRRLGHDCTITADAEVMKLAYADGSHNAETLLVHPTSGDIYIVTKVQSGPASVYKAHAAFGAAEIARGEKIADLAMPSKPQGLLTGGSFSPDGRRIAIQRQAF